MRRRRRAGLAGRILSCRNVALAVIMPRIITPCRPGGAMCRALSCRILAPGPLAIIMPRIVMPFRLGGAACRAGGGRLVLPCPGTGRGGAVRRREREREREAEREREREKPFWKSAVRRHSKGRPDGAAADRASDLKTAPRVRIF